MEKRKADFQEMKEAIEVISEEEFYKKFEHLEFDDLKKLKEKAIYEKVFMESWEDPMEFQAFLEIMVKDSELHAFVDSYFERKEEELKKAEQNLKTWRVFWKNLK